MIVAPGGSAMQAMGFIILIGIMIVLSVLLRIVEQVPDSAPVIMFFVMMMVIALVLQSLVWMCWQYITRLRGR
jgi:hypothetical protein